MRWQRLRWPVWTIRPPAATLSALALLASLPGAPFTPDVGRARAQTAGQLPAALDDRQFWGLIERFSEPDGHFQSDNLVSNERLFQHVVPALRRRPHGGVYLGVAPDQNFTYIVALEPRIAFIVDIRRGNLLMHLMYKAIIELSDDRADFLSLLFSRPRPEALDRHATPAELFAAFEESAVGPTRVEENLGRIWTHLVRTRGFPLSDRDRAGIQYIYGMFHRHGPALTYASSQGRGRRNMPTFAQLQMAVDPAGEMRSYLAREPSFQTLKALQSRNLIVPVVGDFAGPTALREIGAYLTAHRAGVSVFYTSNVEQYLFQQGRWPLFYANVAALPLDVDAVFVRSARGASLLDPIAGLLSDLREGTIQTYADITRRGAIR